MVGPSLEGRNMIGDSFADECAKVDVAVARGAKQQAEARPEAMFQAPQVVYPSLQQNPVLLNTRHGRTSTGGQGIFRGYFYFSLTV